MKRTILNECNEFMKNQTAQPKSFSYSSAPEPHKIRTKEILKKHPEIRTYVGKNPYSFLYTVGIVAAQLGLALWLKDKPLWLLLLVSYTAGALANHALFVLIHECTHNLLFNKRAFNTLAGIFANLPLVVPSSVSFQRYHLKHHAFQGVRS